MKKILLFVVTLLVLMTAFNVTVFADETEVEDYDSTAYYINEVDRTFDEAFKECSQMVFLSISDDLSAYSFLLHHDRLFSVNKGKISPNDELMLNKNELMVLLSFINRVNELVEINAIQIDPITFAFSYQKNDDIAFSNHDHLTYRVDENGLRYQVFDLMPEAREHAYKMLEIYGDNVLGTGFNLCVVYFVDRVKTGGAWDYKQFLGSGNHYFIPEVNENMTGECIGNFHYGYVGKSVFSSTLLLSAAGLYQIYSGTSQWSWFASYFDDPVDQQNIQWGINWYIHHHY